MANCIAMQPDQKIAMYYLGVPVHLSPELDGFRHLFDPKYDVNEAHATLVAPFPASLLTPELDEYFACTIAQFKQQPITARGFHITSRGYIFYTFERESADLLANMYDKLHQYSSLELRREKGRAFMPHITIGKFDGERDVPQLVRERLPEICGPQEVFFDRVRLYGILQEPKKRAHVRDYMLS